MRTDGGVTYNFLGVHPAPEGKAYSGYIAARGGCQAQATGCKAIHLI